MTTFKRTLPTVLLGVASIILLLILVLTQSYFKEPRKTCDASLSPLSVSVHVNQNLRTKDAIEAESATLEPIEINPDDSVVVTAEISPWPEGCSGAIFVDWELSFVVFNLSVVKTVVKAPPSEQLVLTLGARNVEALGEDHVVLIVRDAIGRASREVSIPLRGE